MNKSGLIFRFIDLIHECEALKTYASDVLDKKTWQVLSEAKGNLESFQSSANKKRFQWKIPEDRPLCTNWSDGESQPNGRSGYRIRAKFSFVWEVRKLDEAKWKGKFFLLDGIASTVTTIVDERDGAERCLARWAVEVADQASPGVHFHFQVKGSDGEEPPYPRSLDIPRLPAPLMSPFLAIDLALGELFQDRWKKHALSETKDTNRWRELHRERLKRFFNWQAQTVKDCVGSPWMALKLAKPHRELLVEA